MLYIVIQYIIIISLGLDLGIFVCLVIKVYCELSYWRSLEISCSQCYPVFSRLKFFQSFLVRVLLKNKVHCCSSSPSTPNQSKVQNFINSLSSWYQQDWFNHSNGLIINLRLILAQIMKLPLDSLSIQCCLLSCYQRTSFIQYSFRPLSQSSLFIRFIPFSQ